MNGTEPYARLAGVYDEIVVDPCHAQWAAFLHELWAGDERGVRNVLDVCCGTGLMASELIALNYRIVGVDASPAMLARARRLLGPDVVLVHEALPHLTITGVFDAAVSTFDALNYLTITELQSTFVTLAGRIRPGGWLVFDVHTDAMMEFTAANPVVEGEADGQRFTIASLIDLDARTCHSRIEITRDDDVFTEHHHQYFFTEEHIRGALRTAGFEVLGITDEYTHEPVTETTLRATWTARRHDP